MHSLNFPVVQEFWSFWSSDVSSVTPVSEDFKRAVYRLNSSLLAWLVQELLNSSLLAWLVQELLHSSNSFNLRKLSVII